MYDTAQSIWVLYFSALQINCKGSGRLNMTRMNLQNIQAASLSAYKKQNFSLQFHSHVHTI